MSNLDTVVAALTSLLAWISIPIWLHLCINTFVFGEVPKWIEDKEAKNQAFQLELQRIRSAAASAVDEAPARVNLGGQTEGECAELMGM